MCGRFAMTAPVTTLVKTFAIERNACDLMPSYNIAPGREIAAIVFDGTRRLAQFKWGLVPYWAKDPAVGSRLINARAESLTEKPSFQQAFRRRRCLIVASGFYEWKNQGGEKTPVYIRPKSGGLLCFAGLYDFWGTEPARRLATCAIITTAANAAVGAVHGRMPAIIPSEAQGSWLDGAGREPRLLALLRPYQPDDLVIDTVSKLVNSPANDSPDCIRPVEQP